MIHNIVSVKFLDGTNNKKYTFKNHIHDLQKGDLVVVHARGTYHTARVFQIDVQNQSATKWVVDRINTTMFKLIREGEGQAHQEVSAPTPRVFGRPEAVREFEEMTRNLGVVALRDLDAPVERISNDGPGTHNYPTPFAERDVDGDF